MSNGLIEASHKPKWSQKMAVRTGLKRNRSIRCKWVWRTWNIWRVNIAFEDVDIGGGAWCVAKAGDDTGCGRSNIDWSGQWLSALTGES